LRDKKFPTTPSRIRKNPCGSPQKRIGRGTKREPEHRVEIVQNPTGPKARTYAGKRGKKKDTLAKSTKEKKPTKDPLQYESRERRAREGEAM